MRIGPRTLVVHQANVISPCSFRALGQLCGVCRKMDSAVTMTMVCAAVTREDMWDSFHIAPELRPVLTRGSTSSIGSPSSLFIVATVISLPLQ